MIDDLRLNALPVALACAADSVSQLRPVTLSPSLVTVPTQTNKCGILNWNRTGAQSINQCGGHAVTESITSGLPLGPSRRAAGWDRRYKKSLNGLVVHVGYVAER